MIQRLGGRKLLVVILFALAGVAIDLFTARGLSSNLRDLLIALGGAFGLFNMGSKVAMAKTQSTQIETTPVDTTQLESLIEEKLGSIEEKIKPEGTPPEVLQYLKAIQNGQVSQNEVLKAQAQLLTQTHQTIVGAINGGR